MKCSNCNIDMDMDKGYYSDGYWIQSESLESFIKEGNLYKNPKAPGWMTKNAEKYRRYSGIMAQNQNIYGFICNDILKGRAVRVEVVDAYRCSKCGKIGLFSRLENLGEAEK
ncbi:MAG: hypothetical protein ABIE03_05100 [Patescibacteria group bacterium]|nr:hypothetical protein [Patescibacteria group bacterium]